MIGKLVIKPDPRLVPTASDRDRCLLADVLYLLACHGDREPVPTVNAIAIGLAGCRRAIDAEHKLLLANAAMQQALTELAQLREAIISQGG